LRSYGPRAALLLIVHLNSERTLESVRQDCSFAEKQQPRPARLVVVPSGHLDRSRRGACFTHRSGSAVDLLHAGIG
jgi:hypothetical protein